MLGILRFIGDGIVLIGQMVLWALVMAINGIVAAVGAFLDFLFGLLPDLPAPPAEPSGDWLEWLNWIAPVAELVAAAGILAVAMAVFYVVRVALNWLRAL